MHAVLVLFSQDSERPKIIIVIKNNTDGDGDENDDDKIVYDDMVTAQPKLIITIRKILMAIMKRRKTIRQCMMTMVIMSTIKGIRE